MTVCRLIYIRLRYLACCYCKILTYFMVHFWTKKKFCVQFKQSSSHVCNLRGPLLRDHLFWSLIFFLHKVGRNFRICYWIFNNIQNINTTWAVCVHHLVTITADLFMVTSLKRPYVTFWRPLNLSISSA